MSTICRRRPSKGALDRGSAEVRSSRAWPSRDGSRSSAARCSRARPRSCCGASGARSIAGRRVVVISHALDTRHGADRLASHVGVDFPSLAASSPDEIEAAVPDGTDVVAIDEAQFFGPALVPVVGAARRSRHGRHRRRARRHLRRPPVRAAPLPHGARGAGRQADRDLHRCAARTRCSTSSSRATAAGADDLVAANVGGTELYQARCRRHFAMPAP